MSIEKRIRKLEWTNRALVLALLGVVLVAMTDEEPVPDVVRCKRLEVLREDGKRGASLGSEGLTLWGDQDHLVQLTRDRFEMLDEYRTRRINLDRRGLSVHAKSGKWLADIGQYFGGSGAVCVYSETGDRVISLEGVGGRKRDSSGKITINRASRGEPERVVSISSTGSGSIEIEGESGITSIWPGKVNTKSSGK